MYRHLLVPTDGSELSNLTISRAVAFAGAIGARITFFYAASDFLATGEGAAIQTIAPEMAFDYLAGDAHPVLMKAEAAARAQDVPHRSLFRVSDKPHRAILEAAEAEGCDLIFMASRGPKKVGGLMLGSITLKVLADARVPVLVSSVLRNAQTPMMDKAISIIQDEHRSFAAVLHALRHLVDAAEHSGSAPDLTLVTRMVYYIKAFPDKLHHPKEDAYLFARLRQRTHAVDAQIEQLERDHANGTLLEALEAALEDLRAGTNKDALAAFRMALEDYSAWQWAHMGMEERVILPAAKVHLLPSDWHEIAEALGKNGDPRFSPEMDEAFREMFAALARMAPSFD